MNRKSLHHRPMKRFLLLSGAVASVHFLVTIALVWFLWRAVADCLLRRGSDPDFVCPPDPGYQKVIDFLVNVLMQPGSCLTRQLPHSLESWVEVGNSLLWGVVIGYLLHRLQQRKK
jgi:hypothetical protein